MAYYIVEAPYYYPEHPMTDPDRCRLMDGAKLLVRCKDCKYSEKIKTVYGDDVMYMCNSTILSSMYLRNSSGLSSAGCVHIHNADWFCADGELKETEGKDGD